MRLIKLLVLMAALTVCVGASECSGGSSGGNNSAGDFSGGIEPGPDPGQNPGPASPVPEPSSALIFGLGTLIAAGVTRRRR